MRRQKATPRQVQKKWLEIVGGAFAQASLGKSRAHQTALMTENDQLAPTKIKEQSA
jgi:hypothetical protein